MKKEKGIPPKTLGFLNYSWEWFFGFILNANIISILMVKAQITKNQIVVGNKQCAEIFIDMQKVVMCSRCPHQLINSLTFMSVPS